MIACETAGAFGTDAHAVTARQRPGTARRQPSSRFRRSQAPALAPSRAILVTRIVGYSGHAAVEFGDPAIVTSRGYGIDFLLFDPQAPDLSSR